MVEITNYDDVIDSRDVIARIEELENGIIKDGIQDDLPPELEDQFQEELAELKIPQSLAEDASGSPDWVYGETLVRDSYFAEYAQDLAKDMGMTKDQFWPYSCIDWEKAARELQQDYFRISYGDAEYWIRS